MANISEELKQLKAQKTAERIARQSEMLRKYVKEDLLAALRADIEAGGSGHRLVGAPEELRPLFQAPVSRDDIPNHLNPNSAFAPAWNELKEWMRTEGLDISTGYEMNKSIGGVPWANKHWGAYLYIPEKKQEAAKPVKPTPPPTRKVVQGANFTRLEVVFGILFTIILIAWFILYNTKAIHG